MATRSLASRSPIDAAPSSPEKAEKPGYTVIPPARWSSFQIRATNGYVMDVYAYSRGQIVVEASSRDVKTTYVTPAQVTPGRIQANIGDLGRISMRFHPSGSWEKSREPQGDCRGRRAIVEKGVFRGLLKWRGEGGFAVAKATSAPGMSVASFREVCKGENAGTGNDGALEPALTARSRSAGRLVEVQVYEFADEPFFTANVWEPRPPLRINRSLRVVGNGSSIAFSSSGAATIAPPLPFSGNAEFQPIRGTTGSWTGTLAGSFPGLGSLSLAGPTFSARRATQ